MVRAGHKSEGMQWNVQSQHPQLQHLLQHCASYAGKPCTALLPHDP